MLPILLQNKQKPIRNNCRRNLWPIPISVLLNIEFNVLGKGMVTKRFGFHSSSRGEDEIKVLPISIDFQA